MMGVAILGHLLCYFKLSPLSLPLPFFLLTVLRSKAVPLLQFFFVCASVVSYVTFVLSWFVLHLFFFDAFGRLCFVTVAFPG